MPTMPGLVYAKRRWMIGSDDFLIPGLLLTIVHSIWITIYSVFAIKNGTIFLDKICSSQLTYHVFGQLILIIGCTVLELCIVKVSLNGSILNTQPRQSLNYLLSIRFALFIIGVAWEIYGITIFVSKNAPYCPLSTREIIIMLKCFDCCIWILLMCVIWCSFDPAGKSWVKMKRFQDSLKEDNSKYKYRRSAGSQRNWRHREAVRQYEKSWKNRFRKLCCIVQFKDRGDNSFAEVAQLLSEFFRDLDVVPSDVIAGLSLLRIQQKAERMRKVQNSTDGTYQFLSGVGIDSETKFLDLTHPLVVKELYTLIHYYHYSLAMYGWLGYLAVNSPTQWFKLLNHTKCCGNQSQQGCCFRTNFRVSIESDTINDDCYMRNLHNNDYILGDNCCLCNRAAIQQTIIDHNYKIVYITYQVAVEKPPFFVAVDFDKMSIVVTIRGTLSLSDVLTDLKAEYDLLPVNPPKTSWFGHKGMVSAANNILRKLVDKHLLHIANEELKAYFPEQQERQYPIVVVGHSLGAGTAAILAILLKEIYSNVICFAFAPPGGLLSEDAAEYSKDFIVSVVNAKDLVPRLGLHQMEKLRFDLIHTIKQCNLPKWSVILKSCCLSSKDITIEDYVKRFDMKDFEKNSQLTDEEEFKKLSIHPNDASVSLTVHTPLYPPGSIIQLVRTHPSKSEMVYDRKWRQIVSKKQFIVQALWANNKDFNEIVISSTMFKDHMPDSVLETLNSLLRSTGPVKPKRLTESRDSSSQEASNSSPSNESNSIPVVVETSFTDSHTIPNSTDSSAFLDELRLRKLKKLICKGNAPLASPETVSLSSNIDGTASKISTLVQQQPRRLSAGKPEIQIDMLDDDDDDGDDDIDSSVIDSIASYRQASENQKEPKSFNKSQSDSNLKQTESKFGHLKRSHEEYFLNNLAGSTTIYEEE